MIWHPRVAEWVGVNLFGRLDAFGECQALGIFSGSKLIAGVVFHDWEPDHGTIQVSAYADSPKWFRRAVIKEAMDYAFGRAGVQMILVRTARDNRAARRIWLALGGTEIVIPRLYGRGRDGSLITLTDDQWRNSKFYEVAHGQVKGSGTP